MEYQKSVIELIQARYSCRSYSGEVLDPELLRKFEEKVADIASDADIPARFVLLHADQHGMIDGKPAEKLGTYGMIQGARTYLVGIMDKESDAGTALAFGTLFERMILAATDLELDTCWMGGTFDKREFALKAGVGEKEWIPIVSPIGIRREQPRFFDQAVRRLVRADHRKPWSKLFFQADGTTPLTPEKIDQWSTPLEMVRLGPSASNRQPWRIVWDGERFHFYLHRTKGYSLPHFDIQKNDMGIALCHFQLTASELSLPGKWEKCIDDPDLTDFLVDLEDRYEWEYVSSWII